METDYSIKKEDLMHAVAAACTARLKSHGWTHRECEQSIDAASGKVSAKLSKARKAMLENLAACITNGGSEKHCDAIALAHFCIVGVDIADDLNRARIAERN